MSDPIWSRTFARQIAETLGYRRKDTEADTGLVDFDPKAEQTIEEVTEAFRYLSADKVQCGLDFAEFLRSRIDSSYCPPPSYVPEKLREVRDLVLFLREKYGTDEPADESDEWSDEDERNLIADTWRHSVEEGGRPKEDLREGQRNAEAG